MKHLAFYLGFGALCTHELDSVLNHEWRVIPLIRALSEEAGMTIFVAAHVPFFAILVALISSRDSRIRHMSRLGVGLFLVGHGALHLFFRAHPVYEFSSLLSNLLIYGASAFGMIYLILDWNGRSSHT